MTRGYANLKPTDPASRSNPRPIGFLLDLISGMLGLYRTRQALCSALDGELNASLNTYAGPGTAFVENRGTRAAQCGVFRECFASLLLTVTFPKNCTFVTVAACPYADACD